MSEKPQYPGNSIMVRPDGPLICASDSEVIVEDAEGNCLQRGKELALCRCGLSNNKPFCDGSHKKHGFSATQTFTDQRAESIQGLEAKLVVRVKVDAMLSLSGPVTIFSRDGKSVTTRNKGALCRCGHSANKPFCDRAHKAADFKG